MSCVVTGLGPIAAHIDSALLEFFNRARRMAPAGVESSPSHG
jgi:hypothetical protein